MPWNETYSVSVARIDNQHKQLVSMINGLHDVMLAGGKPDHLQAVLEDLLAYTDTHFADEERAMAQAGYSGLSGHQQKHKAMRAEVQRLLNAAGTTKSTVSIQLMNFLKNWLAKHICETDKAYMPAMKAANIL